MPAKKSQNAAVTAYDDHEVIMPANKLRHAVTKGGGADDDPIARAEKALEELSQEFAGWMDAECERLDAARRAIRSQGFTGKTREALFHAAHDIKGEAATFGFPLVAAVAESLCRLIEHTPDMKRIPLALVDQHVDAVRAIIRESKEPQAEATAATLSTELRDVTDAFLREENKDRLDELEGILSPPLVPGDNAE